MSSRDPFIEQLRRLRSKLTDELADAVTVVGGTAPSLYSNIDRVGLRATQDIDLTITATTRTSWQLATHRFEECGFHSETDGPICRYSQDGVVIDIIPSDPTTIGFGPSRWMGKAADDRVYAREVDLPSSSSGRGCGCHVFSGTNQSGCRFSQEQSVPRMTQNDGFVRHGRQHERRFKRGRQGARRL